MNVSIFAYSRRGCGTARRIAACLPEASCGLWTAARLAGDGFRPLDAPAEAFYGARFAGSDTLIFVGACGIAVRSAAPHLRDKTRDPAVLCVDDAGRYVIPLLGGHMGGANALAVRLADALGALAVITTATDAAGRFSVDTWAAEQGFALDSRTAAKAVSAAVLEGDVPLYSEFPVVSAYPPGVVPGRSGPVGIYIGYRRETPFTTTLRVIPPVLHLGLGCRRGTEAAAVRAAVESVLEENRMDVRAVKCAASIDRKADEAGLLAYCREQGWPLFFYSAARLRETAGTFTASAFVEAVTGVDNVCERAAMVGAETLAVRKTAAGGVTAALAVEKLEVSFGETVHCGPGSGGRRRPDVPGGQRPAGERRHRGLSGLCGPDSGAVP